VMKKEKKKKKKTHTHTRVVPESSILYQRRQICTLNGTGPVDRALLAAAFEVPSTAHSALD